MAGALRPIIPRATCGWCARGGGSRPARAPPCTGGWEVRRAGLRTRSRRRRSSRSSCSRRLPRPDQAQKAGMVFAVDHAAGERLLDELSERLRRPIRLREGGGVVIARDAHFVCLDAFLAPARRLRPECLGLLASLEIRAVVGVVQVLAWNLAK